MAMYRCIFLDKAGRRRVGSFQAEGIEQVYELMMNLGNYPVTIKKETWLMQLLRQPFRKLPQEYVILFAKQVSFSLSSGFSLLQTLHYLKEEATKASYRQFLNHTEQNLLQGMPFSEAITKTPFPLPRLLVDWSIIGEKQGKLDKTLADAAQLLENTKTFKQQLRSQLAYPILVLILILSVTGLLLFIVLPVLAENYFGMYQKMPWYLSAMMASSRMLPWLFGFSIMVLIMVFLLRHRVARMMKRTSMKRFKQGLLKIPVLGKMICWTAFVPFSGAFGQLLESGVSASEALAMLEEQQNFGLFRREVAEANQSLVAGLSLSEALQRCSFVPAMALALIAMGERTGQLPKILDMSSKYYEERLMRDIAFLIKMLEPMTIILLGLIVLMVALGLFIPLLDSYQLFMR